MFLAGSETPMCKDKPEKDPRYSIICLKGAYERTSEKSTCFHGFAASLF